MWDVGCWIDSATKLGKSCPGRFAPMTSCALILKISLRLLMACEHPAVHG